MKVAIVAPSAVPFFVGGAEKLWWGLLQGLNQGTPHHCELIKLPSPERDFWKLMESYRSFSRLDLDHFDLIISTKYPAWMVRHDNHYCYLQHKLRGLYDTYGLTGLPTQPAQLPRAVRPLIHLMDSSRRQRAELEPFFDQLFALRSDPSVPSDTLAFPGPLVRRIVHFLDDIALSPQAIRRYFAISQNVTKRDGYFPPGAEVTVVHHPSDLPRFQTEGFDYLFTASRLDGPKRIALIINAFRQVSGPVELRIAGTGPAEAELKALAEGDPRIRFLGHVSDDDVIGLYANALFVPFVPYDEDYGLVTIEAMQSAKAVLTTTDAGGVNEFVEHGVTGLSVAPDARALAEAMQRLLDNRGETIRMGQNAQDRVRTIGWPQTIAVLLGESTTKSSAQVRRPRLVVALDFPVFPPRGGGQTRVFHLYKELARRADVTLVTLSKASDGGETLDRWLAPGLREIRVAKSMAHLEAEYALAAELNAAVEDIATMLHCRLTTAYVDALARETEQCDLVISSHPYIYPAIVAVYAGPLWYEAHNVEFDMKRAVLANSVGAEPYLQRVRETEAALCEQADRILVCAQADACRLGSLYGVPDSKSRLVANGVDISTTRFIKAAERQANKRRLGLEGRLVVLFIGSWHQPNVEALVHLKRIASDCQSADFLVVGSVARHPESASRPTNVYPLGVLEDAEMDVVLGAADLALNPTTSGSGTNLKMLQYAAGGIPILTTPFGNRGLEFCPDAHLWQAPLAEFPATIGHIQLLEAKERDGMVGRARELAERVYDWRVIADGIDLPPGRSG